MNDSSDIPTEIVELVDTETAMYRMRVAGVSIRQLTRHFKTSEYRVREAVRRIANP